MKKITLLAASALLLLTACGQVENSPAEVVPPLAIETQEAVRQLQATPELSAAAQKPDTVSDAAQEQPQKEKAPQTEAVPQATQPLEPVKEPTPSEDIPSENPKSLDKRRSQFLPISFQPFLPRNPTRIVL